MPAVNDEIVVLRNVTMLHGFSFLLSLSYSPIGICTSYCNYTGVSSVVKSLCWQEQILGAVHRLRHAKGGGGRGSQQL